MLQFRELRALGRVGALLPRLPQHLGVVGEDGRVVPALDDEHRAGDLRDELPGIDLVVFAQVALRRFVHGVDAKGRDNERRPVEWDKIRESDFFVGTNVTGPIEGIAFLRRFPSRQITLNFINFIISARRRFRAKKLQILDENSWKSFNGCLE